MCVFNFITCSFSFFPASGFLSSSFSHLPPRTPLPSQPEVCLPSEALTLSQSPGYGVLGLSRESVRCPEQAGLNQAPGALLSGEETPKGPTSRYKD